MISVFEHDYLSVTPCFLLFLCFHMLLMLGLPKAFLPAGWALLVCARPEARDGWLCIKILKATLTIPSTVQCLLRYPIQISPSNPSYHPVNSKQRQVTDLQVTSTYQFFIFFFNDTLKWIYIYVCVCKCLYWKNLSYHKYNSSFFFFLSTSPFSSPQEHIGN